MDRPLGVSLEYWSPAALPNALALSGRWAALTPMDAPQDSAGLWAVFRDSPWVWDYLFEYPPVDLAAFEQVMTANANRPRQPCYTIRALGGSDPLGYACFWTVVPAMGTVEIGNVNLSPALQRTPIATEAFFLMIDWAFAHGYRRVEWKCNALNAPSRKAAQRLGFSFEGVFRNHSVVKGHSRDTAWFAITDDDWPDIRSALVQWLQPDNFDAQGQQRVSLSDLTRPHLFQADVTT